MSLYLNMSLYPDRRTCPYKWTICNFQPFPKHIFSPIRTCPYIRVHTRNMNPSNSRIEIRDRQNFESVILKCLTHFSQTGTYDNSLTGILWYRCPYRRKNGVSLYPDRRTCPYKWNICNFQSHLKTAFFAYKDMSLYSG